MSATPVPDAGAPASPTSDAAASMAALDAGMSAVLLVFALAGFYAAVLMSRTSRVERQHPGLAYQLGTCLSGGVMLGAGLCHLLADATAEMLELGVKYPAAQALAGTGFLATLLLDLFAPRARAPPETEKGGWEGGPRGCGAVGPQQKDHERLHRDGRLSEVPLPRDSAGASRGALSTSATTEAAREGEEGTAQLRGIDDAAAEGFDVVDIEAVAVVSRDATARTTRAAPEWDAKEHTIGSTGGGRGLGTEMALVGARGGAEFSRIGGAGGSRGGFFDPGVRFGGFDPGPGHGGGMGIVRAFAGKCASDGPDPQRNRGFGGSGARGAFGSPGSEESALLECGASSDAHGRFGGHGSLEHGGEEAVRGWLGRTGPGPVAESETRGEGGPGRGGHGAGVWECEPGRLRGKEGDGGVGDVRRGSAGAADVHATAGDARSGRERRPTQSRVSALMLALSLMVHSLLEGAALGAQKEVAKSMDVFVAIVAHKGLAGYALGASHLEAGASGAGLHAVAWLFALSTPLGVLGGLLAR